MTGTTGQGGFAVPNSYKIFVGQYNPTTRTLSNTKFLRTPDGSGYRNNYGFQIIETTDPATSTTQYYVAGGSKGKTSGIFAGIVYNLDGGFSAKWQVLFQANSNVQFYDVDFVNQSGAGFLNFSGYYKDFSTYTEGYDVKTDMMGYSGCSDSIPKDTLVITMAIDTLTDSIHTAYDAYFVDTTFGYLNDSVRCYDSLNAESKN